MQNILNEADQKLNSDLTAQQNPDREPGHNPIPKPEIEPEKTPEEEPGQPDPERRKKEDDDDDDYEPYEEPEIGDDPDEIKKGTIIM